MESISKLFNKEIVKENLIIDTQDLTRSAGTRAHTDYKIKFNDDGSTNNTAGYGGVFQKLLILKIILI